MNNFVELKPDKTAFFTFRLAVALIIGLIVFLVAIAFLHPITSVAERVIGPSAGVFVLPALIALFLLFCALAYFSLKIEFDKTKYFLKGNKMVALTGGLLWDHETELNTKNITHVTLTRPFVRFHLLGIGHVKIEAAGSGGTEIFIHSVKESEKIYDFVWHTMKEYGFGLKKEKLVQHEKPNTLAVLIETIGSAFAALMAALIILPSLIAGLAGSDIGLSALLFLLVAGLIFLGLIAKFVLRFLDLKNRDYWIYSDVIIYDEGFLTKVDSFIPIENLSDISLTQTLIDKILSLYEVHISCQGSGREILFKNIKRGEEMEKNLEEIIASTESLALKETQPVVKETETVKTGELQAFKDRELLQDTDYTGIFKINTMRFFAPAVLICAAVLAFVVFASIFLPPLIFLVFGLLPLMLVGLVLFGIGAVIIASCTQFFVNKRSIGKKFDFLHKENLEFVNEKITGVVLEENFIDSWFKTFSVLFWSIGSSKDIKFSSINHSKELIENLKEKLGFEESELLYKAESSFSLKEFLKANLFLVIGSFFAAGIILGAGLIGIINILLSAMLVFLIALGYAILIYYKKWFYSTSKIYFYKNHVMFECGIFFRKKFFALYKNIKDIETLQYPFSSLGNIKFNVAGEAIIQTDKGQQHLSHGFSINYMEEIEKKDELIDLIFFHRPSEVKLKEIDADLKKYSPPAVLTVKPSPANLTFMPAAVLIPLNLIAFYFLALTGLAFILPVILILSTAGIATAFLWMKAKTYFIQPYRVVEQGGIIFRHQKSVVFNKIDHLNTSQFALNKLFRNGNVIVNTTGSMYPEMVLKDMPNWREFYKTLESFY